ncbi:low-density lipoprotein receptor-related protein 2-like [Aplysia californica]|uniref:Low-density lipoprotein receptor-related protein 2-like n=1 Tax=Aplysia californica TaxID=6500 RepID=A0ABM1AE53_APLCA|nr:low-density lipoprotein receptor-related protein 2-like [Aplysia californica]
MCDIDLKDESIDYIEDNMCRSLHTVVSEGQSGFIVSTGYREEGYYYDRSDPRSCELYIEVSNTSVLQLSFESYYYSGNPREYMVVYTVGQPHTDSHHLVEVVFYNIDYYRMRDGYRLTLPSHWAYVIVQPSLDGERFKMWYKAVSRDSYIPIISGPLRFELNCSGYEHSLPPYIRCDLYEDCAGGEDEVNCASEDEAWCPGGYVLGSSCYHFHDQQPDTTWQMAEDMCVQRNNGHLIIPNSESELNFFFLLLDKINKPWYLGFRRKDFGAELLYRKVYQGVDGTTVFGGFKQQFVSDVAAACAAWDREGFGGQRHVTNIHCDQVSTIYERYVHSDFYIVCESKKPEVVQPLVTPTLAVVWTAKRETFECVVSKERVPLSRRCDWISDCWDGSDEVGCTSLSDAPSYVWFTCTSGRPLWYSHVCDGVSDCVDGCDEEFCAPAPDDNPALAVCADGVPVPASAWCDAKPDCLDASDELDCSRCNGGALLCPSVGCLPPHWAHDHALDCHLRDKSGQELPSTYQIIFLHRPSQAEKLTPG